MSEQTIYNALRSGGLSPAGACAMMGNMWCESTLKSNIVEKRCSMGDFDYTYAVDNGMITRWQFMADAFGYGLCQWTYSSRKLDLHEYAKSLGVSIGDEKMQCDFCIFELQRDYAELYSYLCHTDDLPEAAKRICAEYECPAVNNFADRINAAQRFYNQLATDTDVGCTEDSCPIEIPVEEICTVNVRVLHKGCLGRDVFLLQCGLNDMGFNCGKPDGDFGMNTEKAVKELQRAATMEQTGIANADIWDFVLSIRAR